jgi:hypothetical protein
MNKIDAAIVSVVLLWYLILGHVIGQCIDTNSSRITYINFHKIQVDVATLTRAVRNVLTKQTFQRALHIFTT